MSAAKWNSRIPQRVVSSSTSTLSEDDGGHGAVKHRVVAIPAGGVEDRDSHLLNSTLLPGAMVIGKARATGASTDLPAGSNRTDPHRDTVRGSGLIDDGGPDPHGCLVGGLPELY